MSEPDLAGWTVVFDLDGVLADTAPDLMGTLNRLLAARGLSPLPVTAARRLVGRGVRALVERGFHEAGASREDAASPALLEAFVADYRAHIADETRLSEGAAEVLERLSARGAILCVATNKQTDLSVALVEALGLARHFAAVVGPDRVSARKPSGAHLREAVLKAGGDPARAIMVGDSETDARAARDAPMPCVLVSFGYSDRPVRELGADAVIDAFAELEPAIDRLTS